MQAIVLKNFAYHLEKQKQVNFVQSFLEEVSLLYTEERAGGFGHKPAGAAMEKCGGAVSSYRGTCRITLQASRRVAIGGKQPHCYTDSTQPSEL